MERVESASKLNPWVFAVGGVAALVGTAALVSLFGPQPFRLLSVKESITAVIASTAALALASGTLVPRLLAPANTSDAFKRAEEVDITPHAFPETQDSEVVGLLQSYLERHPTAISLATILRLAKKGSELTETMSRGYEVKKSRENAQAVTWYILICQLKKDRKGYDSWTWKIRDPNGRLTQFFRYVDGAYDRISTHFDGKFKGSQRGIDFPNGLLPGGKRSLLVIELDETQYGGHKLLAIKPEEWGYPPLGWDTETLAVRAMHGLDYLKSRGRKLLGINNGKNTAKEHGPKIGGDLDIREGGESIPDLLA